MKNIHEHTVNMDFFKVTRTELEEKYNRFVKWSAGYIYGEGDVAMINVLMRRAIMEHILLMLYDILQESQHLKETKDLLCSPEKDNDLENMTEKDLQKAYDSIVKAEAIELCTKGWDEYINGFINSDLKRFELNDVMTRRNVFEEFLRLEVERLKIEFLLSSEWRKFIDEKCGSLKKFGQRNNDTCQRTDASMNLEGSKPGYAKGRKTTDKNS